MTKLVPRDSFFQDLFDFRRDFDQIFNRFLSWPSTQEDRTLVAGFAPAVESFIDKDDKKFHCQVMLPGVEPKDVNIQVQGNTLTISGERRDVRETKEADYHHREITYGSFQPFPRRRCQRKSRSRHFPYPNTPRPEICLIPLHLHQSAVAQTRIESPASGPAPSPGPNPPSVLANANL